MEIWRLSLNAVEKNYYTLTFHEKIKILIVQISLPLPNPKCNEVSQSSLQVLIK